MGKKITITPAPEPLSRHREEAEEWSHALADVLCWFRGFSAALVLSERTVELPPGLDTLRNIKLRCDGIAERLEGER